MPLLSDDLANWTPAHVEALVKERLAETVRLDFKEALDLSRPAARKELAKDLSAMANQEGGFIVAGVKETDGIAEQLTPFALPPGFSELIDNINETCLSPPVPGLRHTPIRRDDGLAYYCIYVPRSEYGPHQVTVGGDYRYYRRNERSCVPMPDSEIQLRIERRVQRREQWHEWADEHRRGIVEWGTPPEIIVTSVPLGPPLCVVFAHLPQECPVDSKYLGEQWSKRTPSAEGLTAHEDLGFAYGGWRISRRGGVVIRRPVQGTYYSEAVLRVDELLGMCRDAFQLFSFMCALYEWSGSALVDITVRPPLGSGLRVDVIRNEPDTLSDVFSWGAEIQVGDPKEVEKWYGDIVQMLYEYVGHLVSPIVTEDGDVQPGMIADVARLCGPGGWTKSGAELLVHR